MTLIELMVAFVIALVVVGTLLAVTLASLRNDRHNEALAQITDDAAFALAVMRQQVAQAGFALPRGAAGSALAVPAFPAVLGCHAANFHDLQARIVAPPSCDVPSAAPDASDALAVAHEGSVLAGPVSNALLGGPSGNEPLDCLGNTFAKTPDPAVGDYWLDDSKFYVSGGSLYCHGPGNAGGAALVQNVEVLRVRYGLSTAAAASGVAQVTGYDAAPAMGSPAWAGVLAVGLCLQMRSGAKVLDAGSRATLGAYVDCDGVARASTDGYLRRTFSTTIALQGRLP